MVTLTFLSIVTNFMPVHKKCVDKNHKIMEKIETSHFENTNFKKYIFIFYKKKSNFEENENPI